MADPRRHRFVVALALLGALAALLVSLPSGARAGARRDGQSSDPLASYVWGVNHGSDAGRQHGIWRVSHPGWARQVQKIAVQPATKWLTGDNPRPGAAVRSYIRRVTARRPGALAFIADFRLPTHERCAANTSRKQVLRYQQWQRKLAHGIGRSPVAIVLEPDLPETYCLPPGSRRRALALVRYAVRVLSRLPHTTIYLDAGSADYLSVKRAVSLLRAAGVARVRGFSLGTTHYTSVKRERGYGDAISRRLHGKHYVLDTSDNGRPHSHQQLSRGCNANRIALGRRPTTITGDRRIDAFLWIGRPWISFGGCRHSAPKHHFWPAQALHIAARAHYGAVRARGSGLGRF